MKRSKMVLQVRTLKLSAQPLHEASLHLINNDRCNVFCPAHRLTGTKPEAQLVQETKIKDFLIGWRWKVSKWFSWGQKWCSSCNWITPAILLHVQKQRMVCLTVWPGSSSSSTTSHPRSNRTALPTSRSASQNTLSASQGLCETKGC